MLDNCEHLLDACARPGRRRCCAACPRLRVLATSREPLRAPGEVTWRVPVAAPRAQRLFARARAPSVRGPAFDASGRRRSSRSSPRSAAASTACRWRSSSPPRAPARSRSTQLAARLGDSLDVLGAGSRTALDPPADAARDDRLEPRAARRRGARALPAPGGVRGRFTLDAAEDVCAGGAIAAPARGRPASARLVDKSLVGRPRTERATACSTRSASTRASASRRGRARPRSPRATSTGASRSPSATTRSRRGRAPLAARARGRARQPARRARLRAALTTRRPRCAWPSRLWRFWLDRGHFAEGTRWLDAALAARARADAAARARRCSRAPALALRRGDSAGYLQRGIDAVQQPRRRARAAWRTSTSTRCSSSRSARRRRAASCSTRRAGRRRAPGRRRRCWPRSRTRARSCRGTAPTRAAAARALGDALDLLRALPDGRPRASSRRSRSGSARCPTDARRRGRACSGRRRSTSFRRCRPRAGDRLRARTTWPGSMRAEGEPAAARARARGGARPLPRRRATAPGEALTLNHLGCLARSPATYDAGARALRRRARAAPRAGRPARRSGSARWAWACSSSPRATRRRGAARLDEARCSASRRTDDLPAMAGHALELGPGRGARRRPERARRAAARPARALWGTQRLHALRGLDARRALAAAARARRRRGAARRDRGARRGRADRRGRRARRAPTLAAKPALSAVQRGRRA